MDLILVALSSAMAAGLTFFSGFGLGSILLPVFIPVVGAKVAIPLVAITHLLNNLFKLGLTVRFAERAVILRFGLPAIAGALAGAALLAYLPAHGTWLINAGQLTLKTNPLNVVIGLTVVSLSAFELYSSSKSKEQSAEPDRVKKWLPLGGVASGFFGGLSGHQGALRTIILVRLGMSKEALIATGAVIACMVDVARLSLYSSTIGCEIIQANPLLIASGVGGALAGTIAGNRFLKKITITWLETFIGIGLIFFGTLLAFGIL